MVVVCVYVQYMGVCIFRVSNKIVISGKDPVTNDITDLHLSTVERWSACAISLGVPFFHVGFEPRGRTLFVTTPTLCVPASLSSPFHGARRGTSKSSKQHWKRCTCVTRTQKTTREHRLDRWDDNKQASFISPGVQWIMASRSDRVSRTDPSMSVDQCLHRASESCGLRRCSEKKNASRLLTPWRRTSLISKQALPFHSSCGWVHVKKR